MEWWVLKTAVVYLLQIYLQIRTLIYRLFPRYLENKIGATLQRLGIKVGGREPWDIQVINPEFYLRVALNPSLGFGETFMDGWWRPNDLQALCNKLASSQGKTHGRRGESKKLFAHIFSKRFTLGRIFYYLLYKFFNLQTKVKAWEVAEKHYDIGNDLYKLLLDSTMNYSCGYWKGAKNLEEAQQNKMELIAQKLKLKPGMRVLDIGCGWGGLAQYLAAKHGVQVVGCTVSKEQAELARERVKGYPVQIKLIDYRDMKVEEDGLFDRIVSVGMFEHIGEKNYRLYFETVASLLKDDNDSLFLCHTIGVNHPNVKLLDPWTEKYIFPNGILPYHIHIPKYTDELFVMEDWHNFGFHYSQTLDAWTANFQREWPKLEHRFGPRFYRMWLYYLQGAAAMFRNRKFQLWQIVLSKQGYPGGYESVR